MSKQHSLTVEISRDLRPTAAHEAVAVCVFEDAPHVALDSQDELQGSSAALVQSGEFRGQSGTSQLFYQASANGTLPRRLLLVGLGRRNDFNVHDLQRAAGLAARAARDGRIEHLYFMLPTRGDQR